MKRGWFVTGTDTGVGKTLVATSLLLAYRQAGSTAGMKPVASGCERVAGRWENADAQALLTHSSAQVDYDVVNPYAFEPAVAPHLAAQQCGIEIECATILRCFALLRARADTVIVEGVGGWHVPLGAQLTMAEVAYALALPVILVVGMRLGCLNHALLTQESIQAHGLTLVGWVANEITPNMPLFGENVAALEQRLRAPNLGVIPHTFAGLPHPQACYLNTALLGDFSPQF